MSKSSNDSGLSDPGLNILVLMTVKKQLRLCSLNVVAEGGETDVNLVVSVVDKSWGVVGYKNVHWWKCCHMFIHFRLFKKVVASGLVLARSAEAAEGNSAELVSDKVQVTYRGSEWCAGIVIAFHGEDFSTATTCCDLEDDVVGQVSTGNQKICLNFGYARAERFDVSDDQNIHSVRIVVAHRRKLRPISAVSPPRPSPHPMGRGRYFFGARQGTQGGARASLTLGYFAMTIHKAQGLTLDAAYLDIRAALEPGQAYVAVSRVRTLAGLHFKDWFKGVWGEEAIRFYENN